ncbi:RNA polymerase sigma factor [Microlunatus parietis]|uniref:RNA polymerase sigma factor (Sigma-70 family) n=1 Tax=Microlunatus parietis TaxID=682979 RepID=A0A7Y9LBF7_9ACTN|nr:sigma-70 family RNA polymerase sigma factor [Microlunatus parietis]NYE70590.1 RNA polymerase sigma factor (sigma-70 family) [Microlunatus parietis]
MTGLPESDTRGAASRAAEAFTGYRGGRLGSMDELVRLVTPLLWHTARGTGLDREAARDVVQTAWLRLVEHADRIADPQAVLGWLIVTVRREAWRRVRSQRSGTEDLDAMPERPDPDPDPGETILQTDEQERLWRHLATLTPRCQWLLRVIAFSDRPDYAVIAEALGMPVGSIGPTRGRCLAKLWARLVADPTWGGVR